jgi:hypothetical protein
MRVGRLLLLIVISSCVRSLPLHGKFKSLRDPPRARKQR